MRKTLMRHAVAHAVREKTLGGLDRASQKQLDRLVAGIVPGGPVAPPQTNRKLRAGTQLVREWQGRVHEVAVVKDGFVWEGMTHRSLSEIAGRITGTRWNGWVFFGLKTASSQKKGRGEVKTGEARNRWVQRAKALPYAVQEDVDG